MLASGYLKNERRVFFYRPMAFNRIAQYLASLSLRAVPLVNHLATLDLTLGHSSLMRLPTFQNLAADSWVVWTFPAGDHLKIHSRVNTVINHYKLQHNNYYRSSVLWLNEFVIIIRHYVRRNPEVSIHSINVYCLCRYNILTLECVDTLRWFAASNIHTH